MMGLSLMGSKETKTRIIKALSEMSPKVRNLIAEVSYAPTKNKQSRIKIFTKDNMQVIKTLQRFQTKCNIILKCHNH